MDVYKLDISSSWLQFLCQCDVAFIQISPMLQIYNTNKSYMPKFDLKVRGQGQTVKISFKAPSKGYVYLFFEENSPSSFRDIEKKLKATPMLV